MLGLREIPVMPHREFRFDWVDKDASNKYWYDVVWGVTVWHVL